MRSTMNYRFELLVILCAIVSSMTINGSAENSTISKELTEVQEPVDLENGSRKEGSLTKLVDRRFTILGLEENLQIKMDAKGNSEIFNRFRYSYDKNWPKYKVGQRLLVSGWTANGPRTMAIKVNQCPGYSGFSNRTICASPEHENGPYFEEMSPLLVYNEKTKAVSIIGVYFKEVELTSN